MRKFIYILFTILLFATSCKKGGDSRKTPVCDGSHPNYNDHIKVIIEGNCNLASCHNSGSGNGDFTSFSGLQPFIADGSFKREVLTAQTMPKGSASLSQKNLNIIQCWVDDNYPEN